MAVRVEKECSNRAERRVVERARKRALREAEKRSPFARRHRVQMEESCKIDVVDGNKWYVTPLDGGVTVEVLADERKHSAGRLKEWASKKEAAGILSNAYRGIAERCVDAEDAEKWERRAWQTGVCGNQLVFADIPGEDELRFAHAVFCHDPLCPICNMRKSEKNSLILDKALDGLLSRTDVRAMHLVLTVPNCALNSLRETITAMHKGLNNMTHQAWWKKRVLGWYAKTEYTISTNPRMVEEERIVHPHMHLLLLVPDEYFSMAIPAWARCVATAFRQSQYNPRRSVGRYKDYGKAVDAIHRVIGEFVITGAQADGVDCTGSLWRSKYRKRFTRMVRGVDALADKYRPDSDAAPDVVQAAVRAFASELADRCDPLYIDERNEHVFLNAWRRVMKDSTIKDVCVKAITHHKGEKINGDRTAYNDAVREFGKYACKDADYLNLSGDDVYLLRDQIDGLHMISAGGIMAAALSDAKKALEDDGPVDSEGSEGDGGEAVVLVYAQWRSNVHAYVITNRRKLTADACCELEYRTHVPVAKWLWRLCKE